MPTRIIYADDEPEILKTVQVFLQQHGYAVETISTTNIIDFQEELTYLAGGSFVPDVIISGGHNVLRNKDGQEMFDLGGFEICTWLQDCALPPDCRFILYSRDAKLVGKTSRRKWGFHDGVIKGQRDSLPNLLKVLRLIQS